MKDLACLHRAPLLTPSFTMDVSEDPDLVQQLNSTQEETATHDPVEEDRSSVTFVVGYKFSLYNDLKKKLSKFEKSQSVQRHTFSKNWNNGVRSTRSNFSMHKIWGNV